MIIIPCNVCSPSFWSTNFRQWIITLDHKMIRGLLFIIYLLYQHRCIWHVNIWSNLKIYIYARLCTNSPQFILSILEYRFKIYYHMISLIYHHWPIHVLPWAALYYFNASTCCSTDTYYELYLLIIPSYIVYNLISYICLLYSLS